MLTNKYYIGNLTITTGELQIYDLIEPGNMILLMDSTSSSSQAHIFWSSNAFIFGGNYHLINVGPLNIGGQYDWAG